MVEKKLKQLKRSKATGPDGIPVRVLKECAVVLCRPLTRLFTLSLGQGIVPDEWKCAHVIACYKSGGKSDPNNYRPIPCYLLLVRSLKVLSMTNYAGICLGLISSRITNLAFVPSIPLLIC